MTGGIGGLDVPGWDVSCFYFHDAAVQTNGADNPALQRADQRIQLANNVRYFPSTLPGVRTDDLHLLVSNLFASLDEPHAFLVHDISFHRAVGAASGNPIVASLTEMVSALYYEQRRATAERASEHNLRDAAEAHRRIYQAIRAHDHEAARRAMNQHLTESFQYQEQELGNIGEQLV